MNALSMRNIILFVFGLMMLLTLVFRGAMANTRVRNYHGTNPVDGESDYSAEYGDTGALLDSPQKIESFRGEQNDSPYVPKQASGNIMQLSGSPGIGYVAHPAPEKIHQMSGHDTPPKSAVRPVANQVFNRPHAG